MPEGIGRRIRSPAKTGRLKSKVGFAPREMDASDMKLGQLLQQERFLAGLFAWPEQPPFQCCDARTGHNFGQQISISV
jgi:hypothetical protein